MNEQTKNFYEFGPFLFDPEEHTLLRDGKPVPLPPRVTETLSLLLQNAGHLVEKDKLMRGVWRDTFVEEGNLNKNIFILRKTLGQCDGGREYIETVPKRGYRFAAAVNEWAAEEETNSPLKLATLGKEAHEAKPMLRSKSLITIFLVLIVMVAGPVIWQVAFTGPLSPPRVINTVQITHDRVPKLALVTDGPRIYINETLGLKQILVQAAVTGGETSVIPTTFANITVYDISPDHSQILAADTLGATEPGVTNLDLPFWAVPLAAGIPRRLGDATGHFATWSPDGRQLAFAKGYDIYAAQADGTNIRKLKTLSGLANWLRFSPDGTRLRFTLTKTSDNTSSLWEMSADGNALQPLLPDWHTASGEDCCGMWSPDGRYYFFISGITGVGSVWALHENTGLFHRRRPLPVQLTTGPMAFTPFVPSLDGRRLFADGWLLRGELVRYEKKSRRFFPFFSDISVADLDFSRDGQWVAYVTWPEHNLWRSRVDGSERLQLTSAPVSPFLPRWSPDGKQIAYVNRQVGHPFQLFLVSSEGAVHRELLSEARQQMDATWSPDGGQIAFGRVPWLSSPDEILSIQVVNLSSKQVFPIPGSENLYAPCWSPDGRHLAALTTDSKKLMLYDLGNQKWTTWIDGPEAISSPSWSRDSKYIYYDSSSKAGLGYRRAKIGETRSELVVDLHNLRRLGYWSGLAPDGAPLFIRDMSADDIYALDLELP